MIPRFNSAQNDSMLFVWTFPRTYSLGNASRLQDSARRVMDAAGDE